MAEREQSHRPTHRAYSVIKREGQDDFWLNVGSVFPHKDGNGFSVVLQALPLDGKIVCREIDENDRDDSRSNDHPRSDPDQSRSRSFGRR